MGNDLLLLLTKLYSITQLGKDEPLDEKDNKTIEIFQTEFKTKFTQISSSRINSVIDSSIGRSFDTSLLEYINKGKKLLDKIFQQYVDDLINNQPGLLFQLSLVPQDEWDSIIDNQIQRYLNPALSLGQFLANIHSADNHIRVKTINSLGKLAAHGKKFGGRKTDPENINLYKKIILKREELFAANQGSNLKHATRLALKKERIYDEKEVTRIYKNVSRYIKKESHIR